MQYADFLNESTGRRYDWRLTNWSSAVRAALGRRALIFFRSAFVALLAPAIVLAVYSLHSNRPMMLVWVFLSFWGFWTSSTGPTGIGLAASMLIALIGLVCAVLLHDRLLFFSALLPGITWMGSCAILGTTASYMIDALRSSEALFQTLVSRGHLTATEVGARAHPPAAGPGPRENPPAQV